MGLPLGNAFDGRGDEERLGKVIELFHYVSQSNGNLLLQEFHGSDLAGRIFFGYNNSHVTRH